MSEYSEMVGSFIRMGRFPMEANYIFPDEAALKTFYEDPINNATLHRGLLKVVADVDGKQALYWVTRKQTNDQLEFTKLISGGDIDGIRSGIDDLIERLDEKLEELDKTDTAIWGTEDKTQIPDDLNSIYDLANALISFREDYDAEVQRIAEQIENIVTVLKAIVGCDTEKIVEYLNTLDYQNLTSVSKDLHSFLHTRNEGSLKIETLLELQDFLDGFTDQDTLKGALINLRDELWGDPAPNTQFRTMRGIQDFVEALASLTKNRDDNLQSELDQTQIGVGLSGDGSFSPDQETNYLREATSVSNALRILDGLIHQVIVDWNFEVQSTDTVDLQLERYKNKTLLTANVLISKSDGNSIIAKSDGLYHCVESEYLNGVLTLKVNGNVVGQHVLGLAFVGIKRAFYDPSIESIVMEFRKEDGDTEEIKIPVSQLIREWTIDNSGVTDVVVLTRVEDFSDGPDKLSADVRLYPDKYNILVKQGNTLYVRGTADNIVWNDVKVSIILDDLAKKLDEVDTKIADSKQEVIAITDDLVQRITSEEVRARQAELELRTQLTTLSRDHSKDLETLQKQVDENSKSAKSLQDQITKEVSDRTTSDVELSGKIGQETARAQAREDLLQTQIDQMKKDQDRAEGLIEQEAERAKKAEQYLFDQIDAEKLRAAAKEQQIESVLNGEIDRSKREDESLQQKIFVLTNDLVKAVDRSEKAIEKALEIESSQARVENKIDTETARASAQEKILEHAIQDEVQRATLQEGVLKERIELYIDQMKGFYEDIEEVKKLKDSIKDKADKSMLEWVNAGDFDGSTDPDSPTPSDPSDGWHDGD